MTAQTNMPLSGAALVKAATKWLEMGVALKIDPDGTIHAKPKAQDSGDGFDMIEMKR